MTSWPDICHPTIKNDSSAVWRRGAESAAVKYWEIIADNLSKAGWSWGCVAAVDSGGQLIFIADAHRAATAEWIYGTRKIFPVYGSFTAVPGANALTST